MYSHLRISKTVASKHPQALYHNIRALNNWDKSSLKTFREKEKMLVNSTFFFSYYIFYPVNQINQFVFCKCIQFGPV